MQPLASAMELDTVGDNFCGLCREWEVGRKIISKKREEEGAANGVEERWRKRSVKEGKRGGVFFFF